MSDLSDSDRIRLIVAALEFGHERPTFGAIASQFRHETGRDLSEVWARTPPPWLRGRIAQDEEPPSPPVDREDRRE